MFDSKKRHYLPEYLLWAVAVVFFAVIVYILFCREVFLSEEINWFWVNGGIGIAFFYSFFYCLFLIFSASSAQRWKEPEEKDNISGCTVIVPAYNEGKHVMTALNSLLAADFPPGKLQIIAVNDGSKDDTLSWINKVADKSGGMISVVDLPENRGKKHALYTGIKMAEHEFIVTVDSDSTVKKDALKKLLYPFADPAVGAVAGTLNKKADALNFHTQMCDVMLVFGCSLLRRAQSRWGNVFCTPGALSAYRRSALLPVLDEWLDQTFMGVPSRIGEDRAIATLLLGRNWQIVYQPEAEAETCLPESYTGVVKMLLRWTRSDFRENIMMPGKVFSAMKFNRLRSWDCFIHWLLLSVNMLSALWILPAVILFFAGPGGWLYKTALFLAANVLWSIFPALIYWHRKRSFLRMIWALVFGFYSQFALFWIGIYSLLTMRDSRWLTREIP